MSHQNVLPSHYNSLFGKFIWTFGYTLNFAFLTVICACGSDANPSRDQYSQTDTQFADTGSDSQNDSATNSDSGLNTDMDTDSSMDTNLDTQTSSEPISAPSIQCTPEINDGNRIYIPNPLISLGATVFASVDVTDANKLTDGTYHSGVGTNFGIPSENIQTWAAIQVSAGPTRLLLTWADTGWMEYNATSGGAPLGYRIDVSADSTDGEDGTWTSAVSVNDNPVRTRGHSFDFDGMSWVKFIATAASGDGNGGAIDIQIDEIALYDISASSTNRPQNTWFFMGDSITQGAFHRSLGNYNFDAIIGKQNPAFRPAFLSGGVGDEFSSDGVGHIEQWLALNPDFQHFTIAYGTNDAWGNKSVTDSEYKDNMAHIIQAVLAAGRTVHLSLIPYVDGTTHTTLPEFNQALIELTAEYNLSCGPDLYNWFKNNPKELGDDGVHPNDPGNRSINTLWAQTAMQYIVE